MLRTVKRIAGPVAAALVSAFLLAKSQSVWWLAGFALVPWLATVRAAGRLEAVFLGAGVGTLSACLALSWIPEALRALGASPGRALSGLVVTAAWGKAPLFAAAGLVARELRRAPPLAQVCVLGAVFGAGEWLLATQSWGLPGVLVGHSQIGALGVAQLAVVGSVPLLSAWLVSLNAAIALVLVGDRPARALAAALATSWLMTAALGLPVALALRPAPSSARAVDLLLVQPAIPRHARWDRSAQPWILERVAAYTTEALSAQAGPVDAIVWPENLLTTPIDVDPELESALQRHVDTWGVPLITGFTRAPKVARQSRYRSSVGWIEPKRGLVAVIDKERGVPLLESSRAIPGASLLAPLFGRAARWPKVEEGPGGGLTGSFALIPALCYEVLFPGIVARRRTQATLAILNLSDDSWAAGEAATRQLSAWAAFRAIEQRLTLVRVAHGGLSTVISPFGEPRAELPLDRYAHHTVTVTRSPPPTPGEKLGILGLPLLAGVGVWWGARALTARGRRRHPEAGGAP